MTTDQKIRNLKPGRGEMMMNATQLLNRLEWVEVDSQYATEPDLRQIIREERYALTNAIRRGDGQQIQAAMAEARRVADMWHVDL